MSNNVNFFVKYISPNANTDEAKENRAYYSSNKSKDYMNYVMTGIEDMKKMDYMEYMNNKEKTYGIFNQNGIMNSDERKRVRSALRKTKSNIWDCLITFTEDFGKKWCDSFEQAYNLVSTELPKFFKRCGLNPDNIEWFAGLHQNTDNRHIHISFFEKEPQRIRPNQKKKMFSIGTLPKHTILEFRPILELAATDFKAKEILARKLVQDRIKEDLEEKSKYTIHNKLLKIANQFPETGSLKYESENMLSLRSDINDLTDYLIKKDDTCKQYKDDFINLAKYKDEMFTSYCQRNDYKQPFTFEQKYTQDFYRRIGNIIIKQAKELKLKDLERLKLNAKYRAEKIAQKKKFWAQLDYALYLSMKVNYEIIKAFQDFLEMMERARYQILVEQGVIEPEM